MMPSHKPLTILLPMVTNSLTIDIAPSAACFTISTPVLKISGSNPVIVAINVHTILAAANAIFGKLSIMPLAIAPITLMPNSKNSGSLATTVSIICPIPSLSALSAPSTPFMKSLKPSMICTIAGKKSAKSPFLTFCTVPPNAAKLSSNCACNSRACISPALLASYAVAASS